MKFRFLGGWEKKRSHKKSRRHKKSTQPKQDNNKKKGVLPPSDKAIIPKEEITPLFIADRGEAVEGEVFETVYLAKRLGESAGILSYVYVIPPSKNRSAIVDLTIDGVNAVVKEAYKNKVAQFVLKNPQVINVINRTKDGEEFISVQAIVECENKLTGLTHFAVKEESRTKTKKIYSDDGKFIKEELYYDHHASTIALEKAQKKAMISHSDFPRIGAREFVKQQLLINAEQLRKIGLTPEILLPAFTGGLKTGRGKYSDVFAKGKSLGFSPQQTREAIASTGKRLSERKTTEEIGDALKKLDEAGIKGEVVDTSTGEVKPQPTGLETPSLPTEKKPSVKTGNIVFPVDTPSELNEHLGYILTFGKHPNKTIREIYETDAGYFRWFRKKCKEIVAEGEKVGNLWSEVLIHLNPVTVFLIEKGLVEPIPE